MPEKTFTEKCLENITLPTDPVPTDNQIIIHNQNEMLECQQAVIEKQDKVIENQTSLLDELKKEHTETLEGISSVVEKLSDLLEQTSNGSNSLTDVNESILTKLDHIIVGSNTVITYGVFYIPLAIISFLLWRFFSTFLKTFR